MWQLAGYARVPDIGWGIIVERPASSVLAALNARRNRDFQTLLAVAAIALVIGLYVARRLSRSLKTLAYATDQLASEDTQALLPRSSITEVAHLSHTFAAMRDRLARRTAERNQMEQEREKLLQRERTAREEAEAANRIKDEFLAIVSHELRSPLNPILGWAKLLRTRQLDPQKTDRALEVIERNAQMQAQLINDLLDVSRILRGKLNLDIQPVDLAATIRAAMETVQLAADAKSIQIHTQFQPDLAPVSGDPGRLQQVVWNLLSNAVKFTPEGGRVDIRLERDGGDGGDRGDKGDRGDREAVSSSSSPPSHLPIHSYAQITITDTGRGIPPEFLPYVFDRFRQESSSTTRRFGGLGLGLAIVRYMVELHGGTVEADSLGEGQGATFTVKLPLLRSAGVAEQNGGTLPLASVPLHPLSGLCILVVDDNDHTREFLVFLLELHGANVIATASASEAIATLTQFQPDVLLSDIGMPDIDGYMLMRQIRALPPEQRGTIPAIALTAYAGEYDHQQALQVGFQRHLAKPVEPEKLVRTIVELELHRSVT